MRGVALRGCVVATLCACAAPARAQSATNPPGNASASGASGSAVTQAKPQPALPAVAPMPSVGPSSPSQVLSLDEASALALRQASAYRQALLDEQSAGLDVLQSRASLLPRLRSSSTATWNRPLHAGAPDPAFIAQNATHEYQELVGVVGGIDFGARAALVRARSLLEAARAGTEIARRALLRGTRDAYFALVLANAKRQSAEQSLQAAEEFARVTALRRDAGEVPEVDAIRARLVVAQRRDEFELARLQQVVAESGLRPLIGYGGDQQLTVSELSSSLSASDLELPTPDQLRRRPEFAQFEAQRRAARAEVGVARAERLPSVTYEVDEGFDAPSLHREEIRQHSGYLATANLNIPIFDWGVSRGKQRQAELRAQSIDNATTLMERDLNQQYLNARQEALTALVRAQHAQEALLDAQRNADVSLARYQAGEAPILEVTDALTTLAQQRLARQQALYDFEIARSRIREAAGR